ncbi:PAB-dependent poly(A)-specific ribonuclease subunit PAN3 [Colletotrichum chrysophilum]|uniref:PAB-dependent poly(A)-specific ribonuclease subunit PAN3 n=1 Tax=Colletotrichum chrysophilum TaxID=1836956 RepID=A0AAD9AIS9_9PEZI|nr:PAB-dependent poly(A)-specific ribonuclease subunit PAN3 [Colletotrichum chrysophilum]
MEALTKEMDTKLKLEGGVTASSEGSRPPEEAIPGTEANLSPQKPQQTFSFTFDEGSLRTAASPGRSTGEQALNPSAPVWTPSPSTTKEQLLPIRLRERPSQQTSRSGETLKDDKDVKRSVGNEAHAGIETQIKATSSESRVVNAKADRQSQTLCRNVVIYGHCRKEGLGCGFKHP